MTCDNVVEPSKEALLPPLDPKIVAELAKLQSEIVGEGYAGSPGTATCIAALRNLTKAEFRKIAKLIKNHRLPIQLTYQFVSDYYIEVFDHRFGEEGKLERVFLFISDQIPEPAEIKKLEYDEHTEELYRYFIMSIGNDQEYEAVLEHYDFPDISDTVPGELVY